MNILYIVPYAPNLVRVRPYQLIRALRGRGHHVTLAAIATSAAEDADLAELACTGVRVLSTHIPTWRSLGNSLAGLLARAPLQANYSWRQDFARSLEGLLLAAGQSQPGEQGPTEQGFDVVHVEHLRGARYGVHLQRASAQGRTGRPIPVVWDSVDCISHLFEQAARQSHSRKGRWMSRLELGRTQRYEGWLIHQFDQVVVTSQADQAALARLAGRASAALAGKMHVVPNGVDLAYFAPNGAGRDESTIVFSGKMSYHANITAAVHLVKEIMPRVWARRPDVQLWIVGKDPSPAVRGLDSRHAAERRVQVTGTVADLRPYLQRAMVAVAPILYGAGIQNKVLEAMACGAPVVASPQAASALFMPGAARTGDDEVGEGVRSGLIVADDAASFAAAIVRLLENPQQRHALGRSGRAYVERHFSWNRAAASLEEIYRKAVEVRRES